MLSSTMRPPPLVRMMAGASSERAVFPLFRGRSDLIAANLLPPPRFTTAMNAKQWLSSCSRPRRVFHSQPVTYCARSSFAIMGQPLRTNSFALAAATTRNAGCFRGSIAPRAAIITRYHHISHTQANHLHPMMPQQQLGSVTHFSSWGGRGPQRPSGNRLAQGAGLLGAASILFGKTKYVLAALKVTKLASLGSMVVTVGTYSMFFGLPYAVGMVGQIFIHEMGHAAAMWHRGIDFGPAVFIPFAGAVISMNQHPRDAWEDAVIGIAGPAAGGAAAGAIAVAGHATNSQLLFALADFGFMINLFNLLPIGQMDGGRISGAISKYVSVAGLGMGGLIAYSGAIWNPIFYLILIAGGYDTFMKFYNPSYMPPNYYRITPVQRATMTASYLGLIVALAGAMDANQRYRKPPEVLMRERQLEKSWDMT